MYSASSTATIHPHPNSDPIFLIVVLTLTCVYTKSSIYSSRCVQVGYSGGVTKNPTYDQVGLRWVQVRLEIKVMVRVRLWIKFGFRLRVLDRVRVEEC